MTFLKRRLTISPFYATFDLDYLYNGPALFQQFQTLDGSQKNEKIDRETVRTVMVDFFLKTEEVLL